MVFDLHAQLIISRMHRGASRAPAPAQGTAFSCRFLSRASFSRVIETMDTTIRHATTDDSVVRKRVATNVASRQEAVADLGKAALRGLEVPDVFSMG